MNKIGEILQSEQRIYDLSIQSGEASFVGIPRKRFRWKKFRFEYGRWHYIVHPVSDGADRRWWVWDSPE